MPLEVLIQLGTATIAILSAFATDKKLKATHWPRPS
jgi:hypothetical protein